LVLLLLQGVCTLVSADTVSNVPDAVTRKTGLRVSAMSRPAQLYAANCQGCHGEAGVSVAEIPALAGRIGYFARTPAGRSYLLQVPNVALNPNSDEALAEMMNWVLATFSRAQLPDDFQPYTAAEVGRLRGERIDVRARRRQIVDQLVALHQVPSADVLAISPSSLY
jgi:mono/diheme cytochrome c family protein